MTTETATQVLTHHQRSSTLPSNQLSSGRTDSRTSSSSYVEVETPRERTPTGTRSRPGLIRSQSAFNPGEAPAEGAEQRDSSANGRSARETSNDASWQMRHGWDLSADKLRELSSSYFYYYDQKRHETGGNPSQGDIHINTEEWRMRDRLKTVSAILALCLNIGVDPPDVIKTNPCARLECWQDPNAASQFPGNQAQRIILQMGKNLQAQYETISLRTRYKFLPDPTHEEMKKYCATLRRTAKDERILFHYNGHGVPKPTDSGEIWVFNKQYTQYIPISLFDLQTWLGAPSLFVWDSTDSGIILQNFHRFAEKHEQENNDLLRSDPQAQVHNFADCIHLAACRANETLPINPQLPADLFTSCLTTPIEMALRIFILQNPLHQEQGQEDAKLIPGKTSERRTPIGELNWVFTAITDTIAWNSLPKHLFKKLFRQDLMVAALFRNFLLAQRIMRRYGCHPVCYPDIPDCHEHPLWDSWDLAVELVLSQLPIFRAAQAAGVEPEYQHSDFFADQLTAFEVYLDQGGAAEGQEPQQLPIVLQVLLSQNHRIRALILLSRFLDLGPWAVKLALGIGIFPYVLKLLQSQANELKPVMLFIWARILAVEQACQGDLMKDNGHQYFISILNPQYNLPVKIVSDHRMMCAFIIAMFCKDHRNGQKVALTPELIEICLSQIKLPQNDHPGLRQWCCLCLSMLWKDFPDAQIAGIMRHDAHIKLCSAVQDPVPEVRAAVLHALTNLLGIPDITDKVERTEESITANVLIAGNDGSNMVRKELVIFFSAFAARYINKFIVAAFDEMSDAAARAGQLSENKHPSTMHSSFHSDDDSPSISSGSIHATVWKHLLILSVDPDPEVCRDAQIVVDYVLQALMASPLSAHAQPIMADLLATKSQPKVTPPVPIVEAQRPPLAAVHTPLSPGFDKPEGYFSAGLKRTASALGSFKTMAFGPATPDSSRPPSLRMAKTDLGPGSTLLTTMDTPGQLTAASGPIEKAPFPKPKYIKGRKAVERKSLPLTSSFFDYSMEYFREPQMKRHEADEPGSVEYNTRLWRRSRNERVLDATQRLKEQAGSSRWDDHLGYFDCGVQPLNLCFHQYDNHVAVSDDLDNVRVWDWKRSKILTRFSNRNPIGSQITGLRFINEDDYAILMTGSSDGVLKLYRHYESQDKIFLTSSYRALTDLVPSTHNAGLVFEWLQGKGSTLVAGDARVIRQWNAETEMCIREMRARSGSCVTSLTSDQVEGNVFVAGFGDGAVRVYDQRNPDSATCVFQWKEHPQWITNVHMQRGGRRELVSGSRNGEVKLWDIRQGKSLKTIRATKDTLKSLSMHEHAPVFVTGTERHSVKIHNMDGVSLSSFQPGGGFMPHSRSSPISATAFHPHRMMLGCAALSDNYINLYSCVDAKAGFSPI